MTFFEDVFPFRKFKADESPASLLWGAESSLSPGDPRLGMFDAGIEHSTTPISKELLKSLGAPSGRTSKHSGATKPSADAFRMSTPSVSGYTLRSATKQADDGKRAPPARAEADVATPPQASMTNPASTSVLSPSDGMSGPSLARRPRDVWQQFMEVPSQPSMGTDDRAIWEEELPLRYFVPKHSSATSPAHHDVTSAHTIFAMITEAALQTITPRNAVEALRSPQRSMWIQAMNREKECHVKNGTFGNEVASASRTAPDRKPIPADWVFKIKHRGGPIDIDHLEPKQFKARVVIRGQFMKAGLDFNDTFAPVAKPGTVRALLAYATANSLHIKTGDVETAFLTAQMDCEVWIRMPPFWGDATGDVNPSATSGPPRLLLKGIPGIPQGSRLFHETFTTHLMAMGFKPADADKCLFLLLINGEVVAVLLWVDDFVIVYRNEASYQQFMKHIRTKFIVPSSDVLKTFLGMEVDYDAPARTMKINQAHTVTVLLERAKMLDCNPCSTPCPNGTVFTKEDCPPDADGNKTTSEYRSLVALANFVSCWTRPDITFTVNKLCKYMSNPGEVHWRLLKHLLRYLKGTRQAGLHYQFGDGACKLIGYTDSSFADCVDTGRSTLAYTFFLGSAIITWYSKCNTYVTTCTNHSEYSALALGAKEAEWLVMLMTQLDTKNTHTPVPIYVDNSGIVSMVLNPVDHAANKHVKLNCHYTRELAADKVIAPVRIPTELNIADIFTKPLPLQQFRALTALIPIGDASANQQGPVPAHSQHTATPIKPTATVPIDIASPLPATASIMMVTTHYGDDYGEDNGEDLEDVESKQEQTDDFQAKWAYAFVLKKLLGASSYDVKPTGLTFPSSGREKLEVIYYSP